MIRSYKKKFKIIAENHKEFLSVFFVYLILVAFPILSNPFSIKYGPNFNGYGSDSYAFLKDLSVRSDKSLSEFYVGGRNLLEGAPSGVRVPPLIEIPALIALAVSKLTGFPCLGYNISVITSFALMFIFSYLFLGNYLSENRVRLLFTILLSYTPFQILQSADHLSLGYVFIFPALFYVWDRCLAGLRVTTNFLLVIFLQGLALFIHPYYFVIIFIINLSFLVLNLWKIYRLIRENYSLSAAVKIVCSLVVLVSLVFWWKNQFESNSGTAVSEIKRSIDDYYTYGLRLADFYLPPSYSWLFSSLRSEKILNTASHGSNITENTLYFGLINILLIIIFLFDSVIRFGKINKVKLITLISIALIPALLCSSPVINIFDYNIKMPSIIYQYVLPQFRTLSRFGFITSVGLLTMGACAFEIIYVRIKQTSIKNLIIISMLAFTLLEVGNLHLLFYSDTKEIPTIYQQVAQLKLEPGASILEVPNIWGYVSAYWTTYHKKKIFNTIDMGNENFPKLISLNTHNLNEMFKFAQENKIEYIVYHSSTLIKELGAPIENEITPNSIFLNFAKYSYIIKVPTI